MGIAGFLGNGGTVTKGDFSLGQNIGFQPHNATIKQLPYFRQMADILTKQKRSEVMRKIRSKNTQPELIVRQYLFANHFRFRLHQKSLPGKPDIALKKFSAVVLINGCFWHGHNNCKYFQMPKSRTEYWTPKIKNNILKDAEVKKQLRKLGWKVFTIWECQLKPNKIEKTLSTLKAKILQNRRY